MGFLRRLFGRDIKTDTAVQNGYTLVADDTKTSGLDWSDVLIRGGLGRDLVTGINRLAGNSYDLDTVFLPGEYYFDIDTLGDRPCNYGLLKVWRESSAVVYQIVQSSDEANNRMFSRCYRNSSWGPWTEYASTSNMPSLSGYATETYVNNAVASVPRYVLVQLTGSGNFTVPAGVTSLKVTVVSGGTTHGQITALTGGAQRYVFKSRRQDGNIVCKVLNVNPGDSIPYVCGTGQEFEIQPPSATERYIREIVAPLPTEFGSVVAHPPVSLVASWGAYGSAIPNMKWRINALAHLAPGTNRYSDWGTPDTYTPYSNNVIPDGVGEFLSEPFETDLNIDSNTLQPGDDGYIIVEY